MQQPPSLPFYYQHPQIQFNQDGNNQWAHQEGAKPNQFPTTQWENNGGAFHVNVGVGGTAGSYALAGQVQGGGGQARVPVPQQQQPPSQPTPTSTPPSMHGDMNKQTILQQQNQQPQMGFIQARGPTLTPYQAAAYPRGIAPQAQQIRTHSGRPQILATNLTMGPFPGVLTQAPPSTIVQTVSYPMPMYGQRQPAPSNYPPNMYVQHAANPNTYYTQQPFFSAPPVISPTPYQSMSSGGPSPQAGSQPAPMPMMRPTQTMPATKHETKRRPNAIKIIDPTTNEEVEVDTVGNNNNITPTRSNDSSARETPQPNSGVITADNTVAADFAARVARAATETQVSSPDDVQDSIPSDSDLHHKQQSIVVPNSEKPFVPSVLSTNSEEFVPRSLKLVPASEPMIEEPSASIPPPAVPIVQTVSAETNSPAIEIQRPKEPFPALKTAPSPAVVQSPPKVNTKKQKGVENNERQQQANNVAPSAQVPLPHVVDNKDSNVTNKKSGGKATLKEECVPMPPKEKREKTRLVAKEQSPAPSPVVSPVVSSQPEEMAVPAPKPSAPPAAMVPTVKEAVKSNSAAVSVSVPSEEVPATPVAKPLQQQNGELPLSELPHTSAVDGNKPSNQRKKGRGNKMRDLNRKGAEKEGSEMEAFTSEPIVNDDKERPSTPISPPLPLPVKAAAPTIAREPEPPSHEDKIKEDLEEKEDKLLVEARNEENAKVSALNKAEEEEPPSIIEKTVPQLTLKRSYKKDQWSPLNQEGKKKYDRDFLLDLKNEPQSQLKPDNLPDVVTVIRESGMARNPNMNIIFNNRDMNFVNLMPSFSQKNSSQRGPLPKRGSQQGNKVNKNPKVIHMSLSLHEDVKLKTVENAWKPTRLVSDEEKSMEERETEEVYKNVRGILNKLTPQKFDTLMNKFLQIPINSEKRLMGVIDVVFEKAVDEPNFSKAYANMCKVCSRIEVNKEVDGKEEKVNFRKLLISKCQTEFEKNKLDVLDSDQEVINNCTNPEKKKELQLAFDEKERQIRRKSVGNIRFIGELFKLGMLTQNIMYRCIEQLLLDPQEESLECLCKLLTTIGKELEFGQSGPPNNQPTKPHNPQALNPYFTRMLDIANKKDASKVSSRVRFMLQDVIDLRFNKWIPRREDNNPKTIEQINKEAEKESLEMSISLSQQPRMNRGNDRQDDSRKRGNRANNNNNQNEDGWTSVGSRSGGGFHKNYNISFDSSKILMKPDMGDVSNISLGGSSMYRFPNTATKSMESKNAFSTANVFNALSKVDDRKPIQPAFSSRMTRPTPSVEKERMLQGAMENDRQSSRGSSVHRDRPSSQPPSRDSSIPRQQPDNKEVDNLKPRPMDDDKWERQVNTIFEEYLGDLCSLDDTKQEIEQLPRSRIGEVVEKAIQTSLEKKIGAQRKMGELINALMDSSIVSSDILVDQLSMTYEFAEDISIDVPRVWELQAYIIVPILASEKINFSHFKSACRPVLKTDSAAKLLVPSLTILAKEKGVVFARKVWDSSNVSLQDFLPSSVDIDAFIKEKSLTFLTGEPPKCQLTMDQVQKDLLKFIEENQPYEKILDFISTNVGDKVKDLSFICALITAIFEACISGSNFSVDQLKLKPYEKLIQRFVDNKEDRELESLNSVHNLVMRLQHPQGLLKCIFNLFLENNLISSESFLKWKENDPKLENKGVSLMTLTSFFTALEEAESSDQDES